MHFKKFVYGRKNWKNFRCSTISKLWDSPLWDTMLFLNCGIYETFITQEMLYLNDCSFVKNTTFNTMECYSVVKRNSFEQAPGDSEEQGSLACSSLWGSQSWTWLSDRTTTKLIHSPICINLANIMLNKGVSQKTPHILWFFLHQVPKTANLQRQSRFVVTSGWRERGMSVNSDRGFFLKYWKCSEIDCGGKYTTLWV